MVAAVCINKVTQRRRGQPRLGASQCLSGQTYHLFVRRLPGFSTPAVYSKQRSRLRGSPRPLASPLRTGNSPDLLSTSVGLFTLHHVRAAWKLVTLCWCAPVSASASMAAEVRCQTCLSELPAEDCTTMDCGHTFCNACWREYFKIHITEGKSRLRCMAYKCGTVCPENKVWCPSAIRQPPLAETPQPPLALGPVALLWT